MSTFVSQQDLIHDHQESSLFNYTLEECERVDRNFENGQNNMSNDETDVLSQFSLMGGSDISDSMIDLLDQPDKNMKDAVPNLYSILDQQDHTFTQNFRHLDTEYKIMSPMTPSSNKASPNSKEFELIEETSPKGTLTYPKADKDKIILDFTEKYIDPNKILLQKSPQTSNVSNKGIDNQILSKEKVKDFSCDKCPKSFPTRHHKERHRRCVHMNIRIHKCPYCGIRFKRKDHLHQHLHKRKKKCTKRNI